MTDAANFFDEIAAQQTPAPVRRKLARDVERAMAKRDAERELEADQKLSAAYGRWKRAQRDALLAGPHGKDVAGLIKFMRTMTLSSAPALMTMVERATFWRSMSTEDRFVLLGILGRGIAACRERNGLEPLDDALWDEPPKAYFQLKSLFGLDGK